MLLVLLVTGVGTVVHLLLPYLGNVWLDLGVRSALLFLVFGVLTILLRIAPDANNLVKLAREKLGM
jgi:hypothetical protein